MATRIFTRAQLYDLVWARPISSLAREFGLSDVALSNLCRRSDIPTPPVGWWAKKAHGKSGAPVPLPIRNAATEMPVVIYARGAGGLSDAMLAAKERAQSVSADAPREGGASERHPCVARTIARLATGKSDPNRLVAASAPDCFKVAVGPASIQRVERFLNRVVGAVQALSWKIKPGEDSLRVLAEGEAVTLAISEAMEETKHTPTAEEVLQLERWERKRERDQQAGIFRHVFDRPSIPPWDYAPSGKLQVQLEHVYGIQGPSLRRTFADGKTQTIESLFGEIIVGIALAAAAKRERDEFYERQRHEREEREQRRLEGERSAALLKQRLSALDRLVEAHERISKIESLLDRLDQAGPEGGADGLTSFLAFARTHVGELRATLAPSRLSQELARAGLFPHE